MAQDDLFNTSGETDPNAPLAERMRPRTLDEVIGQQQLLGPSGPLGRLSAGGRGVRQDRLPHSMTLWGPPGTGKTTIARAFAATLDARFETLSAVMAGVKDIRAAVESARDARAGLGQATVLFIDEVHRFNKSQQDALLPHVEDGTVTLIGATTENPAFELNAALLSRARVYVLESLSEADLATLLERAMTDTERGLGGTTVSVPPAARERLIGAADGDARRLLGMLEACVAATEGVDTAELNDAELDRVIGHATRRFDKAGDAFYDQISALHKSIRGSDPDGALYWLARMIDGGCDAAYIARRLTRIAMEDIGLAQPAALGVCVAAWDAFRRLGSPEGDLALAQAAVHLACAPKSNAVYTAFNAATKAVREGGSLPVPDRLRNASTKLAKSMGHGAEYRYAHDEPDAFAAGERYLPDTMPDTEFYAPTDRGAEKAIAERLAWWRAQNVEAG